jgi:hypothetical protein
MWSTRKDGHFRSEMRAGIAATAPDAGCPPVRPRSHLPALLQGTTTAATVRAGPLAVRSSPSTRERLLASRIKGGVRNDKRAREAMQGKKSLQSKNATTGRALNIFFTVYLRQGDCFHVELICSFHIKLFLPFESSLCFVGIASPAPVCGTRNFSNRAT